MKKSDTGANKTLIGLLRRATAVINEETQLLIDAPNADVSGIVARKNRYLFELSIAMEDTKIGSDDDKVLSALKNLKEAADRNERRLAAQIDAAREIVGILGKLAQANAKDGTYAAHRSF